MAARKNRKCHESTREKIQTTQLINRLTNHVLGKNEMSSTQVRAAEILLNKSLPNLQSTTLTGEDDGPVQIKVVNFGK